MNAKGLTMAAASVAVAVGTYMFLKLGFPHATEEHAEAAKPAPAAPVLAASTAAPEAEPATGTAAEPASEPAAEPAAEPVATPEPAAPEPAPAEVAAAEPEPAPAEPVAEPEPEPAPVEEPEPEPAPAPKPEPAKAAEPPPAPKPAKAETAQAPAPKPAPKPAAPAANAEPIKPWWGADRADRLSLLFASSASYKKAVVLMFNAGFDNAASADKNIKVFDAGGKPVAGKWELGAKNPRMLTFAVPATGRYRVVLNSGLTDSQGRSLASTLQGPVQVQ